MMTALSASLAGLDLRAEIDRLRKEKNAVILAHYYQKPELQDLADFVGDLLELSRKAAKRTPMSSPFAA
jgi:quinolinate synthase